MCWCGNQVKLGIMGGTFNPPHRGHLEAARAAYDALALERILFVPTNIPPHKKLPHASATTQQRCEMVSLMLQDEPWAELCDIEAIRGGNSYTVDTLRALRAQAAGDLMTLIMGTDMLTSFDSWREPAEICRMATLAVVAREHGEHEQLRTAALHVREHYGGIVRLIECPPLPISSTRLRGGEDGDDCLPHAVAKFIHDHRLYK